MRGVGWSSTLKMLKMVLVPGPKSSKNTALSCNIYRGLLIGRDGLRKGKRQEMNLIGWGRVGLVSL